MSVYGGKEMAAAFRTVRKNTVQIAEDIPEDKYDFVPAPGVKTVAKQLAHVATVTRLWPEIVKDGVSGYICQSVDEMAARAKTLQIPAEMIRSYTEQNFTIDRMVDEYVQLYKETVAGAASARRAETR